MESYSDEVGPVPVLRRLLGKDLQGERVGFEFRTCRLFELDIFDESAGGIRRVDIGPLVSALRSVKDREEIESLRLAGQAANVMLRAVEINLVPGVTERELRKIAIDALSQEYPSADPGVVLVVSGERTALPHATTSDRVIGKNDLVMVDLGARVNGYVSDVTRTFSLGSLDSELDYAYQLVLEANAVGRQEARRGISAGELDEKVRSVIAYRGMGEYFTHRTGHGLGLDVHEEPNIVAGSPVKLRSGHVFTIEPGIYLPGKGGIRIEDDVVLRDDGPHCLTSYPRDLRKTRST